MKRDRLNKAAICTIDNLYCVLNVFAALLAGTVIYAKAGKGTYIGYWLNVIFKPTQMLGNVEIWRPIRNWGADFFWAYALFFAECLTCRNNKITLRNAMSISITTSILLEAMQMIRIGAIRIGTFDLLDILWECIGIFAGAINITAYKRVY